MFSVIIVIGCIFVKTNLYYTNPSLVLLGFNVYKVTCKSQNAFGTGIVIIKGKLNAKDSIRYMALRICVCMQVMEVSTQRASRTI